MNPSTWTRQQQVERTIAAVALVFVIIWPAAGFSSYWAHQILIETFLFGIAASSLIFLSAYGGMVSLAQTALFGIAGIILGNLATKGGPGGTSKGLHLGWDPTVALVVAIVATTLFGLIGGAVASRSTGIYFLMITLTYSVIATYTLGQVTKISGFSGIGGINRYTPGLDRQPARAPEPALLHRARDGDRRLRRDPIHRPHAVRHQPAGRPGRAGPHGLARLRRSPPSDDRLHVRSVHRRARRRPLRLVGGPGLRRATSTCPRRSAC